MDDFERVAVAHLDLAQSRARDDLEVALDRHPRGVQPSSASIAAMVAPAVTRRGSPFSFTDTDSVTLID